MNTFQHIVHVLFQMWKMITNVGLAQFDFEIIFPFNVINITSLRDTGMDK